MTEVRLTKGEQEELDLYRADLIDGQLDFDPVDVEMLCHSYKSWLIARRDDDNWPIVYDKDQWPWSADDRLAE